MQQLLQELRSPRLRSDGSTEGPSSLQLRAARAIESLMNQGRQDFLARQRLEKEKGFEEINTVTVVDSEPASTSDTQDTTNPSEGPEVSSGQCVP